jgi:hypothetical protein
MRPNSLAFRLSRLRLRRTLVVLPVAGFLLLSLYRHAVERSFDARLNVYLRASSPRPQRKARASESARQSWRADFTIPFSGWY